MMKDGIKKRISEFAKGWAGSLIIAFLVATSIKSALADWYVVPTGSMKPTIMEGDRIFVNKLAFDLKIPYTTTHLSTWDNPERGNIVVFYSPKDNKRLVKRVIGLPGDLISMDENRLYINGDEIPYEHSECPAVMKDPMEQINRLSFFKERLPGLTHEIMVTYDQPAMRSFPPISVPQGYYFMMGDNRDNSADSRYFGFVERSRILGRATTIVMSLNPDRYYKPRWDRFFNKLN
jgi:signal peptidase I